MTFARRALAAAALALLAACVTIQKAPTDLDLAVKEFAPPPKGRAALYVFRNESMGATVKMSLNLDGKFLGDTVPKTFYWVPIKPGKHTLVGKAENESTLEFTAKPGQSFFVWQEVKMKLLSAENRLQIVDDERGQAGVAECELVELAARAE
ncbi:MAG: DUF2846 domain-containing protein [Myxococcales bacterium]